MATSKKDIKNIEIGYVPKKVSSDGRTVLKADLVEISVMEPKDPKKVKAGKLGGKKSGANFKRNRKGASLAGQKSAWKRHGNALDKLSLPEESGDKLL